MIQLWRFAHDPSSTTTVCHQMPTANRRSFLFSHRTVRGNHALSSLLLSLLANVQLGILLPMDCCVTDLICRWPFHLWHWCPNIAPSYSTKLSILAKVQDVIQGWETSCVINSQDVQQSGEGAILEFCGVDDGRFSSSATLRNWCNGDNVSQLKACACAWQ